MIIRSPTKFISFLLFFLICSGCSISKKVSLKSTFEKTDQYIGFKLDKADLYFRKEDILNNTRGKIDNEADEQQKELMNEIFNRVVEMKRDTLLMPYALDISFEKDIAAAHVLLHMSYMDLLNAGKVMVMNKRAKMFEDSYYFRKIKSNGGMGISYTFKSGEEFYYYVIDRSDK